MKLKKFLSTTLCLLTVFALAVTGVETVKAEASDPIATGKMKNVSNVYFGKSESFPTIGLVGLNQEIDIYEYDKNWVLTKCETSITQGTHTYGHSFYGYVKRSDVLFDPPLEGDESSKADTGPGKRKKKPPKRPGDTAPPAQEEPDATKSDEGQKPESEEVKTEDMSEYDWIVRTPGVCQMTVDMGDGAKFVCRFSLYAMKFGGYTASSLPVFNDGDKNPYVGYVSFSMKQNMQDFLGANNLGFLEGLGDVDIQAYNNNARFSIDSQTDSGTNAIISIMTNRISILNPQINDNKMGIKIGGEVFRDQSTAPLDMKLIGDGGGYKIALLHMKPGGGDLIFPAMLEKFPLSDIEKAERKRLEEEMTEKQREEQRARAKEEQERAMEEWRKRINEGMEEELDKESQEGEESMTFDLPPLVDPAGGGTTTPTSESTTDERIPLAPLVDPPFPPLVPLTGGGTPEEVGFFPESKD